MLVTNDAKELLHRDGRGPGLRHIGFHRAGHRDIQVRGGELNPPIGRAQQDIGQDGQSSAGADDILHRLQAVQNLLFGNGQVHDGG
jgi:hypothetical protein